MNVIKRRDYLNLLAQSNTPNRRNLLLKWGGRPHIDIISEIAYNCLKGNVTLSKKNFNVLKKHRNILREIASKQNSLAKKKRIISQRGGFLSTLIPIVLTAIGSAVLNKKKKNKKKIRKFRR